MHWERRWEVRKNHHNFGASYCDNYFYYFISFLSLKKKKQLLLSSSSKDRFFWLWILDLYITPEKETEDSGIHLLLFNTS